MCTFLSCEMLSSSSKLKGYKIIFHASNAVIYKVTNYCFLHSIP